MPVQSLSNIRLRDELVNVVRREFESGPPNANRQVLDEWATMGLFNRFESSLYALPGVTDVKNLTETSYARCNSFLVDCRDGARFELVVSFLAPVYDLWCWGSTDEHERVAREVENRIRGLMQRRGFTPFPREYEDYLLSDIELELDVSPTLWRCVFDESAR